MSSVVAGGPGLVAVGSDFNIDGDSDAAVWTSPDGFNWSRVPHDEAVFGGAGEQGMSSVVAGGPGLVAVGSDGIGVWVLTSSDQDFDPVDADAAVWTSSDGITWSRVPHDEAVFGGEGGHVMLSVTSRGPGLVAVGAASSVDTGDKPSNADAAVWVSVDGFTWSRVPHDPEVFAVSDRDWMASVIAGGPGLVAVGSTGDVQTTHNAAVWTSADGITWTLLTQSQDSCHDEMWSVADGTFGLVAVGQSGCGPATGGIWHAAVSSQGRP
jgi:hypothetical protein